MTLDNLRISVCIASYNGELYIRDQLHSILNQLGLNDEIIICDDASTDGTVKIIKSINDPRIFLIENDVNLGVSSAFNAALVRSSGELVFICDQDDVWLENKVSQIIAIMKADNFDIVVHDAFIDVGGVIQDKSLFNLRNSGPGIVKNIFKNTYTGCCITLKRSLLLRLLPLPSGIGPFHDAWIGILSEIYGANYFFFPKCLIYFRRHAGNVSSLVGRRSLFAALADRFRFVYFLFKRFFHFD